MDKLDEILLKFRTPITTTLRHDEGPFYINPQMTLGEARLAILGLMREMVPGPFYCSMIAKDTNYDIEGTGFNRCRQEILDRINKLEKGE